MDVRSSESKQAKQQFTSKTDILANTFQKPSSESNTYSLLQLKCIKSFCVVMVNLYTKVKGIKETTKF